MIPDDRLVRGQLRGCGEHRGQVFQRIAPDLGLAENDQVMLLQPAQVIKDAPASA